MHNIREPLWKHYGSITEHYRSATGRYGVLWNITEHCGTLRIRTEPLRNHCEKYRSCPSLIKFQNFVHHWNWAWLNWACWNWKWARRQILIHTNRLTNYPSNNYDMVIFCFFKMVASCHLEFLNSGNLWLTSCRGLRCITLPNFIKISQAVVKILRFLHFMKMAAVCDLGLIFHVTGPPMTHIWWSLLLEERLWKKTVRHMDRTGRMPWIVLDGRSR